jgi:hypothetical protein
MKFSPVYITIAVAVVIAAGAGYTTLKYRSASVAVPPPSVGEDASTPPRPDAEKYVYDPLISVDAKNLYQDQSALYSYVKKYGPKKTVEHLATLVSTYGSCHDAAHRTGRIAYELFGSQAFQQCGADCHSGCYHGATEAFFHEHGTANLAENLKVICSSAENAFFSHQCIHGIGHGLMAWTNYDLFDALSSCDLLSERQDSCWTGVFMENIVGGIAKSDIAKDPTRADHFTKYLSSDPQYPCNDPGLQDKYKSSCYFLQTSRMLQLFGNDWKKVADACSGAPAVYQRSCFESMGRDIGGTHHFDEPGAIAACQSAPAGAMRIGCLVGAAQDAFWDPSGQDHAIRFCTLLKDRDEKDACYGMIFSRAPDVLLSKSDHQAFCAKAEPEWRDRCLSYIQ